MNLCPGKNCPTLFNLEQKAVRTQQQFLSRSVQHAKIFKISHELRQQLQLSHTQTSNAVDCTLIWTPGRHSFCRVSAQSNPAQRGCESRASCWPCLPKCSFVLCSTSRQPEASALPFTSWARSGMHGPGPDWAQQPLMKERKKRQLLPVKAKLAVTKGLSLPETPVMA